MLRFIFYLVLLLLNFNTIVFSAHFNPLNPILYKPKIFDCFLFYNELELLEIRFEELYEKVDKFVLVESTETFRGNSKPLYFHDNKQLFAKYADKIIYVCVESHPEFANASKREFYQRNQIMRGLIGYCHDDDVIMISDLDEIIRASAIDTIVDSLLNLKYPYVHCDQLFYRFFLNQKELGNWIGSSAMTFKLLKLFTPEKLREMRDKPIKTSKNGTPFLPYLKNSGWHFSYMGGHDRVLKKIAAYSHAEFDTPALKEEQALHEFFCNNCVMVEIDDSYPSFVIQNIDKFRENGFIYVE